MSRSRSAILMLVGSLLLAMSVHGDPAARSSAVTSIVAAPDHAGGFVVCRLLSRASHSERLSRFTAWKARPKMVLAESDRQVVDESDLGPAPVASGLIFSTPTVLTFSRLSTPTPLRC